MHLAGRVRRVAESATLKLARRALQLKARGLDIVDLVAGDPDFPSPPAAVEAARAALASGFTRYTDDRGIGPLREALASRYAGLHGAPWTADETLITVGAKGALFELAFALFEEGDEVVTHTPAWVSIPQQARLAGATVVEIPTRAEEGFAVDPEAIRAALGPRTRAVILNSPCNPTGAVIDGEALAAIVAACAERGVLAISDETYERFVYDGREHASVAALATRFPETIVLVGSFSKSYAMTGWRVGYLLAERRVVDAVARIQGHATSNATSFAMAGAVAALQGSGEELAPRVAEYQARRDLAVERLNALPHVRCTRPAGAFYVFPDVSGWFGPAIPDADTFAERLLDEGRVAVVSGAGFGGPAHVRISLTRSREELDRGITRLGEFLGTL